MTSESYRHPLLDWANQQHFPTVAALLEAGAALWPDRLWCRTPDGDISRAKALQAGRRVAAGLAARGVTPGDRVVIVLPNGLDFVRTWMGVVMAEGITVGINPAAAVTELAAVVEEIAPKLVVVSDSFDRASGAAAAMVTVNQLLDCEPAASLPRARTRPDDPVSFIQSSGTTGRPKFIIETNAMYTMAAEGFPYWLRLDESDVLMTCLPLSHLNAQVYSMLGSYGCGAKFVLLPRFSASTFWADVVRFEVTEFNAIGAMLEILMRLPSAADERDNPVRICYAAPTPTPERHQEIEARFGLRLVVGFAQSESPYGLVVSMDVPQRYGTMGRARQHPRLGTVNQARIVDARGEVLGVGATGEIEFRNPATSPGYFNNPRESAAIVHDGWLRTGDLATSLDEGYFAYAGRLKELIRRRGENLSPIEVENVLDAHPAVMSSAVIGVASEFSEEDVKAFVMMRPDVQVLPSDLKQWCADRLPRYKVPRYLEFTDEWPLTETHKIAKRQLSRERTEAEFDLEGPGGAA